MLANGEARFGSNRDALVGIARGNHKGLVGSGKVKRAITLLIGQLDGYGRANLTLVCNGQRRGGDVAVGVANDKIPKRIYARFDAVLDGGRRNRELLTLGGSERAGAGDARVSVIRGARRKVAKFTGCLPIAVLGRAIGIQQGVLQRSLVFACGRRCLQGDAGGRHGGGAKRKGAVLGLRRRRGRFGVFVEDELARRGGGSLATERFDAQVTCRNRLLERDAMPHDVSFVPINVEIANLIKCARVNLGVALIALRRRNGCSALLRGGYLDLEEVAAATVTSGDDVHMLERAGLAQVDDKVVLAAGGAFPNFAAIAVAAVNRPVRAAAAVYGRGIVDLELRRVDHFCVLGIPIMGEAGERDGLIADGGQRGALGGGAKDEVLVFGQRLTFYQLVPRPIVLDLYGAKALSIPKVDAALGVVDAIALGFLALGDIDGVDGVDAKQPNLDVVFRRDGFDFLLAQRDFMDVASYGLIVFAAIEAVFPFEGAVVELGAQLEDAGIFAIEGEEDNLAVAFLEQSVCHGAAYIRLVNVIFGCACCFI